MARRRPESDLVESNIQNIVNLIPGINVAYNAIRAIVYSAKGDTEEVEKSIEDTARNIDGLVRITPFVMGQLETIRNRTAK